MGVNFNGNGRENDQTKSYNRVLLILNTFADARLVATSSDQRSHYFMGVVTDGVAMQWLFLSSPTYDAVRCI